MRTLFAILMVVLLSVPGAIIGYAARFFVSGFMFGWNMQRKHHTPENDNDPD